MHDNYIAAPLVAVVIPAYNEASSIDIVVKAVKQYALPIVVDDGSSDGTADIAELAGALVVTHTSNQGYDISLQSGLFKAIALGCKFAVTMDADGQHNPDSLNLFKVALFNGADIVVGARDHHQRFSEVLFALAGRFLWSIKDPLCGMKGYRLSHLERLGHFDSYKSIGTEFVLRCARSGLRIDTIQISTRNRVGISRFGDGLRSNYRIIRSLAVGLFKAKAF